jgi:hypothetical protein
VEPLSLFRLTDFGSACRFVARACVGICLDAVIAVPAVPRTRTGKKLELPAKRILQGRPIAEVATPDSLLDPHALDAYLAYATARDGQTAP